MYQYISGFSDEISADITTQFEVLNKLGIKYFEPRGINGKNISELDGSSVQKLKEVMNRYGIKASSIGSPIGKIKIGDDFGNHFDVFKRVVDTAKTLESDYIRIFSFYHDGGEWTNAERDEVMYRIDKMADYAKKCGVILLHENEKNIYGDTAKRCADIMNEFYGDSFGAVFDPANFVQCGEDTKAAYDVMKNYIKYMHIKDAEADGTVVPSGEGCGNVGFILHSLFENGYGGFLSLEPHLGSFEGLSGLEYGDLMKDLPKGGEGTFTLSYRALMKILEKEGR